MCGQVILLNGPSSGGKSTLARALQRLLEAQGRRFGIVSIDDLLEMSPDECARRILQALD